MKNEVDAGYWLFRGLFVRNSELTSAKTISCTPPETDFQAFVSQILREFPANESFSAESILQQHPFLWNRHSCVIDLVYEEYCRLRSTGSDVTASEFAARYPGFQNSICRVIELDNFLQNQAAADSGAAFTAWPSEGDTIGGVTLIEQIGRGVLSRVFVGRQERLGNRHVVAKVCLKGAQEADLICQLDDPAIAVVYSADTVSQGPDPISVICMPYRTRATLHHVIERIYPCRISISAVNAPDIASVRRAVDFVNSADAGLAASSSEGCDRDSTFADLFIGWALQLSRAVVTAHSRGILHSDIKPGNILVLPDLTVQLLDFNLASQLNTSDSRHAGGTLPYMAPEQILELKSLRNPVQQMPSASEQTDIWGLCATLWHLASGSPPFGLTVDDGDREHAVDTMELRHREGLSADDIAIVGRIVSSEICSVLQRGLSTDPGIRICTARELVTAFRRSQRRRSSSDESRTSARHWKYGRHSRLVLAGLFLTAISVALAFRPPAKPDMDYVAVAARLQAEGKADAAGQLLAAANVRFPQDEGIAVGLTNLHLQRGKSHQALQTIRRIATADSSDYVRYLDLYLRCIALPVPREMGSVSVGEINNTEESFATEWMQHLNEWKLFQPATALGRSASINIACMYFEMGMFRECESVLRSLDQGQHSDSVERMALCLKIRSQLAATGTAQVDDLRQLSGRPTKSLSRSEATLLVRATLKKLAGSYRDDQLVRAELEHQLTTLLDEFVPLVVDARSLKSLFYDGRMKHFPDLLGKLNILSRVAPSRQENRLELLLISPADASSGAESQLTGT